MNMKRGKIILLLSLCLIIASIGVTSAAYAGKKKFNWLATFETIEKSKVGIERYKNETKVKINDLNEKVDANQDIWVTITFAKPLNKQQVEDLINRYNIKIDHLIARAMERKTGLRGTLIVTTPDSDRIDPVLSENEADLKGFIEAVGYVPNKKLRELSEDKLLFVVDPSADDYFVDNPKKKCLKGLFWELEDYGMIVD
ncbi:hypothetical protein [Thermincola potens]|uniref:Uncharacterized protein n=1 Tax=Thermincola potens (strain JR) TaxID=635013 RepID=D5XCD1_THEPJ|nr:hypothetical protein [Thermincola potens]ADG83583.1 conserved hypothetical protein [Thermincola potens JR]